MKELLIFIAGAVAGFFLPTVYLLWLAWVMDPDDIQDAEREAIHGVIADFRAKWGVGI